VDGGIAWPKDNVIGLLEFTGIEKGSVAAGDEPLV
jgi:hypothetical protein